MTTILAMSDLHGRIPKLPKAIEASGIDLLIDCGDTAGHFNANWNFNDYFQRMVNVPAEAKDQLGWFDEKYIPWRNSLKPKVTLRVNGNHDFADASGKFDHYVFEGSKTVVVDGLKIGILAGSGKLVNEWNDEIGEEEFEHRIQGIDRDVQMLVSHMPPYGIMDRAHNGDRIGSRALTQAIFGRIGAEPYFTHLSYHLYGHCHEGRGQETHDIDGRKLTFLNVAETYCTIETSTTDLKHHPGRVSFHSK